MLVFVYKYIAADEFKNSHDDEKLVFSSGEYWGGASELDDKVLGDVVLFSIHNISWLHPAVYPLVNLSNSQFGTPDIVSG